MLILLSRAPGRLPKMFPLASANAYPSVTQLLLGYSVALTPRRIRATPDSKSRGDQPSSITQDGSGKYTEVFVEQGFEPVPGLNKLYVGARNFRATLRPTWFWRDRIQMGII